MSAIPELLKSRNEFHRSLLESILTINEQGVVSNADGSNKASREIAQGIAARLKASTQAIRPAGQTSGNKFENLCAEFIRSTFSMLSHLRPGDWNVFQVSSNNRLEIAKYEQYSHLIALDRASRENPELAAALGNDYTITPDIVVSRSKVEDDSININQKLVSMDVSKQASIRKLVNANPILHASISCKWTIRSDRAQNARSEALNLIRNRKGKLPHIMVVTGEPTPNRLASIALGTGDIDCTYHFALYELQQTLVDLNMEDSAELLSIMVEGNRLKDISDLPLDLAV